MRHLIHFPLDSLRACFLISGMHYTTNGSECLHLHEIYLSAPCSDPGKPWNGIRIGDDFTHGKFIKFICDDDFEGVGKKTIQCLNGKWSHKIPQCKGKRCIR